MQSPAEPRPCESPVQIHGADGYIECLGRFLDGQASREAKLDHAGLPRVEPGQSGERLVEDQDVDLRRHNDGVADGPDNCPNDANPDQSDVDGDGSGDACDVCPNDAENDADSDGVCGDVDNCPLKANAAQGDGDGLGDVCDACPNDAENDADGDGVCGNLVLCHA